jgi:hypothetical protein
MNEPSTADRATEQRAAALEQQRPASLGPLIKFPEAARHVAASATSSPLDASMFPAVPPRPSAPKPPLQTQLLAPEPTDLLSFTPVLGNTTSTTAQSAIASTTEGPVAFHPADDSPDSQAPNASLFSAPITSAFSAAIGGAVYEPLRIFIGTCNMNGM